MLLLLMAAVAVAQPGQTIVGDWVQESQNAKWTFRSDGTGFMERGQPKLTARFSWLLRGQVLQVSTASTSVDYEVVQSSAEVLVIRNSRGGQVYELRRQPRS